jgi:hypothetical protein
MKKSLTHFMLITGSFHPSSWRHVKVTRENRRFSYIFLQLILFSCYLVLFPDSMSEKGVEKEKL